MSVLLTCSDFASIRMADYLLKPLASIRKADYLPEPHASAGC